MGVYPVLRVITVLLATLTTVCYLYQLLYLVLPLFKQEKPHAPEQPNRYAVLIAARNEEAVLPHLLASIREQDYPAERIQVFVVADNCTDRTAEVARAGGATVFSRFNRTQVGKGYALNFLLQQIEENVGLHCFDAFLIFDADNLLQPDYIRQMNRLCSDGFEAFCGYRNSKNFGANWLSQGYGLWYLHDSCHLNQSRMLLGTTCAVSGTGFGFTRELLERMGGWNFFTLTEDLEFNAWCATRGVRIGYCPEAMLYDEQPERFSQSWRQRTRWTQGGVQVSLRYAGDLLRGLFKGGWTSYASFETATLSLWGYGIGILSCGMTLLLTFLTERWLGLGQAILAGIGGTYSSMFLLGALTLCTQWRRIPTTTGRKIATLFTFPLFLLTFIPISVTAVFRKFQWQPITHTVAISNEQLSSTFKP